LHFDPTFAHEGDAAAMPAAGLKREALNVKPLSDGCDSPHE
jgi:hypothetical protein